MEVMYKVLQERPFYAFYQRLIVGSMAASLFFVAGLMFLQVDFLRLALNFLCVVSGFLLAMHLVRLAICQNIPVLAATEDGLGVTNDHTMKQSPEAMPAAEEDKT
jgi:hypothetical protein